MNWLSTFANMRVLRSLVTLLGSAAVLVVPASLSAQAGGVEDVAAVVATSLPLTAPDGSTWAFLRWDDTRPNVPATAVAIYRRQQADGLATPLTLSAVIDPLADTRTVAARLARTRVLGGDLTALNERLDALFGGLLDPASGFSLADKLASVALAAEVDEEIRNQLGLLLRLYPAAAVALGRASLEPLTDGAVTDFELRLRGPAGALLGRLSQRGGEDFHLPAPGRPRALAEPSARGHLNVRLVWSTPPALGAMAFQQYGYSIYRVESDFAVAQGWVGAPPAPGLLPILALDKPDLVARANALPVLVETPLDDAGAAAVAAGSDPDAFQFADDNDRFRSGSGFADGDQFYYFVTARDLLGRDGLSSPGTLVTVCDRLPPPAPIRVRAVAVAVETGGGVVQQIEVSWDVDDWARPDGQGTAAAPGADGVGEAEFGGYHVYRFPSIAAMQAALAADFRTDAFRLTAAPLFPVAGADRLSFRDDGASAPHAYAADFPREGRDESTPWWYVVRALDASSCGGNLSGASAPVPGIIRDWTGPDGASGGISGRILEVALVPPSPSGGVAPLPTDDPAPLGGRVVCLTVQRTDPGVLWAEITQPLALGRIYFSGSDAVTWRYVSFDNKSFSVEAVAGAAGALPARSTWSPAGGGGDVAEGFCLDLTFTASTVMVGETPGGQRSHQPTDPVTGEPNCLTLAVTDLPIDAREYKLYRRQGALGPATLVDVGEIPPGTMLLELDACQFSPRGGDACFAIQLFDEHGNPGPLTPLGCVPVLPTAPLPKPLLAKVEAGGTPTAPTALLEWFAPLPGLERFELLVEDEGGEWPIEIVSPWFSSNVPYVERNESRGLLTFHWDLARLQEDGMLARLPGTVGLAQPSDGTGLVRLEVPVRTGVTYRFQVRAAGPGSRDGRVVGPASDPQAFVWLEPAPPAGAIPQVPWPAEGRPAFATVPGLEALVAGPPGGRYLAVRVGRLTFAPDGVGLPMPDTAPYPLPAPTDPHAYLFRSQTLSDPDGGPEDTATVLPGVLYRYQVANAFYPDVSGQLVQVTPLLASLAWTANAQNFDYPQFNLPASAGKDINLLQDPYFRVFRREPTPPPGQLTHDLLLLDPQPAVLGARYAYVLVRFNARGEIFRLLPVGEVTFTSQP